MEPVWPHSRSGFEPHHSDDCRRPRSDHDSGVRTLTAARTRSTTHSRTGGPAAACPFSFVDVVYSGRAANVSSRTPRSVFMTAARHRSVSYCSATCRTSSGCPANTRSVVGCAPRPRGGRGTPTSNSVRDTYGVAGTSAIDSTPASSSLRRSQTLYECPSHLTTGCAACAPFVIRHGYYNRTVSFLPCRCHPQRGTTP
jgi:hypothetical protein